MVVGHQKGKSYKERTACYFGCAHPEGYRKAMAKMRLAAKFHLPVICLIDTPGAYPGIGAEERGQHQVIAESMYEMSRLPTPVVCVVIGEGGSGGALAIGVGDRVAVLEHAYYSVISPEGCAGILWKSHTFKEQAAAALKMTSKDLKGLGVIDAVIPEPLGGAHRDHHQMARRAEELPADLAPRAGGAADRGIARRPLPEVPPHGRVARRRRWPPPRRRPKSRRPPANLPATAARLPSLSTPRPTKPRRLPIGPRRRAKSDARSGPPRRRRGQFAIGPHEVDTGTAFLPLIRDASGLDFVYGGPFWTAPQRPIMFLMFGRGRAISREKAGSPVPGLRAQAEPQAPAPTPAADRSADPSSAAAPSAAGRASPPPGARR